MDPRSSPINAARKFAEMDRDDEGIIIAEIDVDEVRRNRAAFGFFRDRRPDLYETLADDK